MTEQAPLSPEQKLAAELSAHARYWETNPLVAEQWQDVRFGFGARDLPLTAEYPDGSKAETQLLATAVQGKRTTFQARTTHTAKDGSIRHAAVTWSNGDQVVWRTDQAGRPGTSVTPGRQRASAQTLALIEAGLRPAHTDGNGGARVMERQAKPPLGQRIGHAIMRSILRRPGDGYNGR